MFLSMFEIKGVDSMTTIWRDLWIKYLANIKYHSIYDGQRCIAGTVYIFSWADVDGWSRILDINRSDWYCSVSKGYVRIRRGRTKQLSAQKSNANTVGLNFQTISIFSINLIFQVTLKFSKGDILHSCQLLKHLYSRLYLPWVYDEFLFILCNIQYIKITELDGCQIRK